ncbi:26S proteasome regulatory complex, subunit PSMD10 [Handroanthus impetiginosus]|uniref:26S proteasome regulatory complex, subunit PSMD10 n=1 Tax=Handroanthus impetiginosus TaxID=429701 RepID=A0A2G9G453_9LAMI|nr:26S proteasome regulatory complex, subunit PSMD10 [Handroanthus impetiginosus]
MAPKSFPLRWDSTGDQWWFASPIDWAAANGHYDLVRELLYIDPNLLFKLTSLPRIRRLETVWDDEENFSDVAKFRSQVAQKLLQECETKEEHNSLIEAGYGGWLLYTAASAGDVVFVKELLDRDPFLVFGEGEYGVTDMLYAAARSKNCDVFRVLFDCSVSPIGQIKEVSSVFRSEMMNRAVHAAARGGNLDILKEILKDCADVLAYRDAGGSMVLHTASGGGQVEVVKHVISSYDIIDSTDNQGNTSLNVAAYRGHLSVVEVLLSASPSSASLTNKYGDTFLHMAVSGFRAPSFRRLDKQIELMKQLISGKLINMEDIINLRNNDGRTSLHMAAMDNIQPDVVELLMSAPYINLNIRDADGKTPLDLLKQRPQTASSEILIKRLISAGGISNCEDQTARNALVSHLRMRDIGGSPGTSFRIPDAEIFLHAGVEELCPSSRDYTSTEYGYSGEIERVGSTAESNSSRFKKFGSINSATSRLKILLRWPGKKDKKADDNDSNKSYRTCSSSKNSPIPLRQQFEIMSSLPNNKRILSLPQNLPSPSTKKKFSTGLSQGILRVLPKSYFGSPSSAFSKSSFSSPVSEGVDRSPNVERLKMKRKNSSFNFRLMNSYFCFGAQGLAADKSVNSLQQRQDQGSAAV